MTYKNPFQNSLVTNFIPLPESPHHSAPSNVTGPGSRYGFQGDRGVGSSLLSFHGWKNQGSEELGSLPKTTQSSECSREAISVASTPTNFYIPISLINPLCAVHSLLWLAGAEAT